MEFSILGAIFLNQISHIEAFPLAFREKYSNTSKASKFGFIMSAFPKLTMEMTWKNCQTLQRTKDNWQQGGGFKYLLFSPLLGEDTPLLTI